MNVEGIINYGFDSFPGYYRLPIRKLLIENCHFRQGTRTQPPNLTGKRAECEKVDIRYGSGDLFYLSIQIQVFENVQVDGPASCSPWKANLPSLRRLLQS